MQIRTSDNFLIDLDKQEAVVLIQELAAAVNACEKHVGGVAFTDGQPIIKVDKDERSFPSVIIFCVSTETKQV